MPSATISPRTARAAEPDVRTVLNSVGFFSTMADNDAAEIALGMRPNPVGKGNGATFVESCLDYAHTQCGARGRTTLDVAGFNARAIRVLGHDRG